MILDQSADIFYGAKSTTDLCAEDFWQWCRDFTRDIHHDGKLYFLTAYPNHEIEIDRKLREGKVNLKRVMVLSAIKQTRTITIGDNDVEETTEEYLDVHSPADQAALKKEIKRQDFLVIYKPIGEDVEPFKRPPIFSDRTHVLHEIDHKRSGVFAATESGETVDDAYPALCDRPNIPLTPIVGELVLKD